MQTDDTTIDSQPTRPAKASGRPSAGPDGRSIAYQTDRTGNGDIYVIEANGHNKIRLTSTADVDVAPPWQPP